MRGRDSKASQVLGGAERRVVWDRESEAAPAVAQVMDLRHLRSRLGDEVQPGDPKLGNAVAHELDDVVCAHEQDVQVEVLNSCDERPLAGLEDEPGVAQQADGRLDQSALVRNGKTQAAGHRVLSVVAGLAARSRSSALV